MGGLGLLSLPGEACSPGRWNGANESHVALNPSATMLIDNAEVTSMIQPASSQKRKLLKHRYWMPGLSSGIHHQLRPTRASKFQEFEP